MQDAEIVEAFRRVLSVDQTERQQAEAALASLQGTPGLFEVLCRIALSVEDLPVRQSAVLLLKNCCRSWTLESSRKLHKPQVPLSDQLFLRSRLVHFLSPSMPTPIRSQFLKIAKTVAKNIPVREWTELLAQLDESLFSSSQDGVVAGLALLFQVVKAVSKRLSAQRKPEFSLLAGRYFGRLLQCLQETPTMGFECHVLILKAYHKGTYIEFLEPLNSDSSFRAWMKRCQELLSMHRAVEGPDKHPAWLTLKWSMRIAYRCISREASLTSMSPDLKRLTQCFMQEFAHGFVHLAREILLDSKTKAVPDAVRLYCWKFLSVAAKSQGTKVAVQQSCSNLLSEVVLPQIYRVPAEEALWRENPSEFLQQESDFLMTTSCCKFAAVDFVVALCNGGLLDDVLAFISKLLAQEHSALVKEAVLLLLGSLSSVEALKNSHSSTVSQGLKVHALPELQSVVPFLRFRALWVYGRFSHCAIDQDQQLEVLHAVCQLLTDSELPVRVEASATLAKVLHWNCADSLLQPEIENLLAIFKTNMEQLDSEDLIDALEALVDRYSTSLVPYAPVLVQKLCETFTRTAQAEKMTATPVLSVLIKITAAMKNHQTDLHAVSVCLLPILQYSLSPQGEQYFEEGLALLTNLIVLQEPMLVQHLYSTLPLLVTALVGRSPDIPAYAFEYYEQCFNPLANFASKDKTSFGANGRSMLVEVARHFFGTSEDGAGYEYHFGSKLLMCLLENYEEFYAEQQTLLTQTVAFLITRSECAWKLLGLELASVLFHRNVPATFSALPHCEATLRYWFENLDKFKTPSSKLHIAMAFIAFLSTFESLPELLKSNLCAILQNLIRLLSDLCDPQDSESESEDESWSPIEDEQYTIPVRWQDLALSAAHSLERMRQLDARTASSLEASLPEQEKQVLRRLITAASS